MPEESQIEAMRAAIRGDLERARSRRPTVFERPAAPPIPPPLPPPVAAEPEPELIPEPEPVPADVVPEPAPRPGLLDRLLRRR